MGTVLPGMMLHAVGLFVCSESVVYVYNAGFVCCVLYKNNFLVYNFCFSQLFMATLKRQSNGLLYSNTVIGILAVDGWTVIFGTARRGPTEAPPRCTKCNSWPVNWQCTNLESFGVAL